MNEQAPSLYAEQFGRSLATNNWLMAICLVLGMGVILLAGAVVHTVNVYKNPRPLVLHVNDLTGEVKAFKYADVEYQPQAPEVRYFLMEFCRLHWGMSHLTLQDDFPKSLYFVNQRMAPGMFETWRDSSTVKAFLANPSQPEIEVEPVQVSLDGLIDKTSAIYRGRVNFFEIQKAYLSGNDTGRTLYTAVLDFRFMNPVPAAYLKVNPIGLEIDQVNLFEGMK